MNLPTPDTNSYINAKPFPHCIVDGVFYDNELRFILAGWPKKHQYSIENEGQHLKSHTNGEKEMGQTLASFIKDIFQSQEFIGFLEQLTGIKGLVLDCFDPSLHETYPGGWLKPHLDYTICPRTGLQHRVNAILFLNENWKPEYGGNLDLYEGGEMYGRKYMKDNPAVSIEPIFNRIAIINIDPINAWHGASLVSCPEGMSRKSIAVNYMSLPDKKTMKQRTLFHGEQIGIKQRIKRLIRL